jgi:5-enolpyruvylshikimate-3-phosphate synthase
MADGPTRITGYLESADTRATLRAVADVGAEVGRATDDHGRFFVEIEGIGLRGPRPAEIDVGNAGTLLRIMPGWLAGQRGASGLSTATSRSAVARSTGSPSRCADGRRRRLPRRAAAPAARPRLSAQGH